MNNCTTDDDLIAELSELVGELFKKKPEELAGYIYFLCVGEFCKIGRTKNLEQRLRVYRPLYPHDLHFQRTLRVKDMFEAEAYLHRHFEPKNVKSEWFRLDETDWKWIATLSDNFYELGNGSVVSVPTNDTTES